MDIYFYVHSDTDQQWILQRLAKLINGNDEYRAQEQGFQYALGTANDWWVSFEAVEGKPTKVRLCYRYGVKARMDALRMVILWLLGVDHLNEKIDSGEVKV